MVVKLAQLWPYHKHSGAVFKKSPNYKIKKLSVTQALCASWRYPKKPIEVPDKL